MSKDVYKPKPVSGFPEWLPGWRRLEQSWLDHIRRVFESYGYTNIETPAVEDVNVLQAKGDIAKEIYGLHRLNEPDPLSLFGALAYEFYKKKGVEPLEAEEKAVEEAKQFYIRKHGNAELAETQARREVGTPSDKDVRLALHFDLTVPMARFVAQNFNDLEFPFKRYAMQKVWRGERPQKGRMREFYQCDIDVIGVDALPLHFDAEMPAVMHEVFQGLGIGRTQIRISNRKILSGLIESGGVKDSLAAIQIVDKLEKIGADQVAAELNALGAKDRLAQDILTLVAAQDLSKIIAANALMDEGLKELSFVLDTLKHLPEGAVVADLSIARGLDYYTGTVYETRLLDVPEFTGSVCSGGRYDDLAGRFINKHLPGVGISIGLSRLFDVLMQSGRIEALASSPTQILITLPSDEARPFALETAATLRARGFNVEVYHAAQKPARQFSYAEKKGIPFVWSLPSDGQASHRVKNITTSTQYDADASTFVIDAAP